MKRVLTLTLLATIIFGACNKEKIKTIASEQSLNYMVALPDDIKTGNSTFLLLTGIGHNSKDCNGCVTISGHTLHVNCMGHGNECVTSTVVQLQYLGSTMNATTTDTFNLTSEDFFLMPDRSLLTEDEKGQPVYLNIPAQLVYRDSTTLQFSFTGLYYTESPEYTND